MSGVGGADKKAQDAATAALVKAWTGVQIVRTTKKADGYVPVGPNVVFVYDSTLHVAVSRGDTPGAPLKQQELYGSPAFGIPAFGDCVVGPRGCAGRRFEKPVLAGGKLKVVVGMCPEEPHESCVGTKGLQHLPHQLAAKGDAALCEDCCDGMQWWAARAKVVWVCPHHDIDSAKVTEVVAQKATKPKDAGASTATEWAVPGAVLVRRNSKSALAAGAAVVVPLVPAVDVQAPAVAEVVSVDADREQMRLAHAKYDNAAVPAVDMKHFALQLAAFMAKTVAVEAKPIVDTKVEVPAAQAFAAAAGAPVAKGPARPPTNAWSQRSVENRSAAEDRYAAAAADSEDFGFGGSAATFGPQLPGRLEAQRMRLAAEAMEQFEDSSVAQMCSGSSHSSPPITANAWAVMRSAQQDFVRAGGVLAWYTAREASGVFRGRDGRELESLSIILHFLMKSMADGQDGDRVGWMGRAVASACARAAYLMDPLQHGGVAHSAITVPTVRSSGWLPDDLALQSDKAMVIMINARKAAERANAESLNHRGAGGGGGYGGSGSRGRGGGGGGGGQYHAGRGRGRSATDAAAQYRRERESSPSRRGAAKR